MGAVGFDLLGCRRKHRRQCPKGKRNGAVELQPEYDLLLAQYSASISPVAPLDLVIKAIKWGQRHIFTDQDVV